MATGIAAETVAILFSSSDGADLSGCAIGGGAPRSSSAKSVLSMARNDSACCVGATNVGMATGRVSAGIAEGTVAIVLSSSDGADLSGCAIGGAPRRSSAKSVLSMALNDSAFCVGATKVGVATGRVSAGIAAGTLSIFLSSSDGAGLRAVRSTATLLEFPRLNPCSQWRATIPPVAWAQRTSEWPRGESRE